MKGLTNFFRRAGVAGTAFCASAAASMAQKQITLENALNQTSTSISSIGSKLANVVSIIMVTIGIVLLIWNFVQRAKGDAQSADKLMSFVWGLLFAFLILTVLRAIAGF